ncbi:hypothetical protein G8770_05535 [Aestuariicella hydrocarbonica]|uniref:DUF4239 domain-containing protein n=1 Tax=Pseudomaricurvus hydrocarbonicus TaxID=1470433 RepID=A0A9E5MK75_9GAMM|nr:hypothetical protein [Aestuariicella hydrocarbonica]NHO65002.1 hypothetical protein [Aestuariicella hydrocarbonica]
MFLPVLYELPMGLISTLILVCLITAVEIGYRFGWYQRRRWENIESGGGAVVQTSILALLGLLLAFTYGAGVSRFDARKSAVIQEVNAIGSAFNVADLIAEPERTGLRQALLDYARTRTAELPTTPTAEQLEAAIRITTEAQSKIWPLVNRAVGKAASPAIQGALISNTNHVLDMHQVRLAAINDFLPISIVILQLFVASASLTVVGFNTGLSGRISRWRMYVLALVVTAIMFVILDFDLSKAGFIQVNDTGLKELVLAMEAEIAGGQ